MLFRVVEYFECIDVPEQWMNLNSAFPSDVPGKKYLLQMFSHSMVLNNKFIDINKCSFKFCEVLRSVYDGVCGTDIFKTQICL